MRPRVRVVIAVLALVIVSTVRVAQVGILSRWRANKKNETGQAALAEGRLDEAEAILKTVVADIPDFEPAWFNLGLLYKRSRRWQDSLRCNAEAARLRQKNEPALWNLGIAATAVGDWATARRAWRDFGLNVPDGEGPIEMKLGYVPIRVDPDGEHPEVLWCQRIDPARAIVGNVPLPTSGRRLGDLLLHDGEPKGTRVLPGKGEVPVFNELQLLTASPNHTLVVRLEAPTFEDMRDLVKRCAEHHLDCEDWTANFRMLCKACSEGRPHEHHAPAADKAWAPARMLGFSSTNASVIDAILVAWKNAGAGRDYSDIEQAL